MYRSEIESEGVLLLLLLAWCRLLLLLNGCCTEGVTHGLLLRGNLKVIEGVLTSWALLHRLVRVHPHHGHLLLHCHHLLLLRRGTTHHVHRVWLLLRGEASHHGLEARGWLLLRHAVEGVLRVGGLLCTGIHQLRERVRARQALSLELVWLWLLGTTSGLLLVQSVELAVFVVRGDVLHLGGQGLTALSENVGQWVHFIVSFISCCRL